MIRNMPEEYMFSRGYTVWQGNSIIAEQMKQVILEKMCLIDSTNDDELLRVQGELGKELRAYPRCLVEQYLDRFKVLLGPDLMIQKYPYLRIARPGKAQDNIGYHRDTLYGSSPYELSVLIAITDMKGGAAMKVLPGSHLKPEAFYQFHEGAAQCEKGSAKHALGFLYAPKVFGDDVKQQMVSVEVAAGDMLIFFPSLIHGQEVNSSDAVRMSFDVRMCNAYAPIKRERTVHADYYEPMSAGVTSRVAEAYASL